MTSGADRGSWIIEKLTNRNKNLSKNLSLVECQDHHKYNQQFIENISQHSEMIKFVSPDNNSWDLHKCYSFGKHKWFS